MQDVGGAQIAPLTKRKWLVEKQQSSKFDFRGYKFRLSQIYLSLRGKGQVTEPQHAGF
jgi:hypothetical protein